MGKKLVGANCVEEYICQATGKIYVDGTVILSPGAKDKLRNKGITIIYGSRPDVAENDLQADVPAAGECVKQAAEADLADDEKLIVAVAQILKNEYGITDPEQMIAISSKVVTIIKENN